MTPVSVLHSVCRPAAGPGEHSSLFRGSLLVVTASLHRRLHSKRCWVKAAMAQSLRCVQRVSLRLACPTTTAQGVGVGSTYWEATALCCMAYLQGLLDTPGGEERVVLKRVKARVQVRTQRPAFLG